MPVNEVLLRLISIKGLGPRRIISILNVLNDPEEIWNLSEKELCSIPGIDIISARAIREAETDKFYSEQIKYLKNSPFRIISILDKEYPVLLKNISEPPIILFVQGKIVEKDHDAIAVVGTRTPTEYGMKVAQELSRELTLNGFTVVSGFARGIDTLAHKAVLGSGGRTIAVLGNGIDRCYPPENYKLRAAIAKNGAYISEFPFGTKPDAMNFPKRNRIISGLSLGTLVIEAGDHSGALLTGFYAIDQNREVFAIPGRIDSKKSIGTNRLIKHGAALVQTIDDILKEVESIRKFPTSPRQMKIEFNLNENERRIIEFIREKPMHVDDLSLKLNMNSAELLSILLMMELKDIVRQLPGKQFIKK